MSRDVRAARDAGYPDVLAPPTFLTIVNLGAIDDLIADPGLSLDYDRMVHGDQGFVFERPVHAGDRLKTTTSIDDVYTRAGNDFVTLRAAVHADTGELVCTARAQLVERGEA